MEKNVPLGKRENRFSTGVGMKFYLMSRGSSVGELKIVKFSQLGLVPKFPLEEGEHILWMELTHQDRKDCLGEEIKVQTQIEGENGDQILEITNDPKLLGKLHELRKGKQELSLSILQCFRERQVHKLPEERAQKKPLRVIKWLFFLGVSAGSLLAMDYASSRSKVHYASAQGVVHDFEGDLSWFVSSDLVQRGVIRTEGSKPSQLTLSTVNAISRLQGEIRVLNRRKASFQSDQELALSRLPELKGQVQIQQERISELQQQIKEEKDRQNVLLAKGHTPQVESLRLMNRLADQLAQYELSYSRFQAEVSEASAQIERAAAEEKLIDGQIENVSQELEETQATLRYMSDSSDGIIGVIPESYKEIFDDLDCRLVVDKTAEISCTQIQILDPAEFNAFRAFGQVDWKYDRKALGDENAIYFWVPFPEGGENSAIGVPLHVEIRTSGFTGIF